MNTKKIAIVGHGYVGKAMEKLFQDHYQIEIHDIDSPRRTDSDIGIVCVPTPSLHNRCDTSIVEEVVDWLTSSLIIIKSTIEPGTTDRLKKRTNKQIVFSPEFCGESSYWSPYPWDRDIKESPFFIFGGDPKDTSLAVSLYLPVTGPTKRYIQTDAKSAEMMKYISNSFFATKITFAYEIDRICQAAGLDYNKVRELWLLDPRINPMHTAVFQDNDRPFGGKCLPKDTAALVEFALRQGYEPKLIQEVLASNERMRKK